MILQATVIGITAAIQISFYITAKQKYILYLFGFLWTVLSYFYITETSEIIRFFFSFFYLTLPWLIFKNAFTEEAYAKAYNICIQAIVSVGAWYLSEHIFYGNPVLVLLANLALNSVWCIIMSASRKKTFAIVPYPEKNYKKAFIISVILYSFMQVFFLLEPEICRLPLRLNIPVLFCMVISLVILNIMNKFLISNAEIVKTEKMALIEANQKQMQHYLRDYQLYTEELRRFKHDQKHIVAGLKMALEIHDLERAGNILNQLSETIDSGSFTIYCTDNFINAILTDTEHKCKNADINFFASVQIGEPICIRDTDLIAVLMNIMNNAVENCDAPTQSSGKHIKISIFTAKSHMVIKCENTIRTSPDIRGNHIATTKENKKHHGIGIESIKHIAHSYAGTVAFTSEHFLFRIEVVMENKPQVL